ncbi:thioredoxin-like protein, partial [Catenaria anguillulae PL171]
MIAPKLESLANKHGDALKVIKIDTDEAPEAAQEHGITALPTVVLFKDGKELGRFMGVRNEAQMQQFLDEY